MLTAYGQALMWWKGYTAEETASAFAQVATASAKTQKAPERHVAYFGQWIQHLFRGQLQNAEEIANTFLREADLRSWLETARARNELDVGLLAKETSPGRKQFSNGSWSTTPLSRMELSRSNNTR